MTKLSTRKTLSIIMMLAIVLSAIPLLTGSAEDSVLPAIVGVVKNDKKATVPNPTVSYVNIYSGAQKSIPFGSDGGFSFGVDEGIVEGSYIISASADGYVNNGSGTSGVINVKSGEKTIPLIILYLNELPQEKYTVKGVINKSAVEGIDGATVKFRYLEKDYLGYSTSTTTELNATWGGNFSIELFKGKFHMTIWSDKERTYSANITITGDTDIGTLILDPKPYNEIDSVYGIVIDKETKVTIEGSAVAYLYDWSKEEFLKSETEGKSYNIPAYTPGKFMLIVDAEGYKPYYNTDITLTNSDPAWPEDVELEPIGEDDEVVKTTIDFGSDWNTTKIASHWTMTADSKIHGLKYSHIGDLRFQIDFEDQLWDITDNSGYKNKNVDANEKDDFEGFLDEVGPNHITTKDFITINGSYYLPRMIGNDPDHTVKTTNVNRFLDSDDMITIETNTNYELEEGEAGDSFKLELGDLRDYEYLIVKIPKNYEISKWSSPHEATEVELINFHEAYVNSSDVTLTVNRLFGPRAVMSVTGDYVKPLTDIKFDGNNSEDVSGRGIQNWTWDFKDGSYGYGAEVTHNFSKAGKYNVTLTVMDSSDLTDVTWKIIQVDDTKPTPRFILQKFEDNETKELDKDSEGRYIVDEESTVFFNATTSSDTLDGNIQVDLDPTDKNTYVWDFGDGRGDNGVEVNNYYRYYTDQVYDDPYFTVVLNVTDKAGNYKNLTQEIVVMDTIQPDPYILPVASKDIGEVVTWDATESQDNYDDAEDMTYIWDFGDNTTSGEGITVNHTYTKPGIFTAKVNVTDKAGNWWEMESEPVVIRGVNLAVSNIFFDKNKIEEGKKLKVQVNVTNAQFAQNSGATAYDVNVTLKEGDKVIGTQTIDMLEFGIENSKVLNFTWKAKGGGKTHSLTANITLANESWELSWDDNEKTRKIDVTSPETPLPLYITIVLIVVVIVLFLVYFLRRKGIIGGSRRSRRRREKSEKKKGKKK